MRSVLLLGATGLVGGEILKRLLADPDIGRVVVLARRPVTVPAGTLPRNGARLDAHVVDFEQLEARSELFAVDQVFCALGTTIRQAGSQERFRRVDHDYPLAAARLAHRNGATHYLLVSAIGADAQSRVFYNRVKGAVEQGVRAVPFRSVTIVRPSLLLGDRSEFRLGEELAKRFAWAVPRTWKPVHAGDVAQALVDAARIDAPGVRVIESREIPRDRS